MLKPLIALGLICSIGTGEPPNAPARPPAPPPPPPMPTAMDCWRDFFVNIGACQHDFEGTDRIVVAQRRAALSGAAMGFNSCLNLVPMGSPVTTTPEVPANARPWTCLEQLVLDIKECRTKFSPGVPLLHGDPERDTMKNAFDQCINGAVSKNGWCNGRKPNNPVAPPPEPLTRLDVLEGPALSSSRQSVTVTVAPVGTDGKPVNVSWFAAVFNERSELVSEEPLGTTVGVPATPTKLTLALSQPASPDSAVIVVGKIDGDSGGGMAQVTRLAQPDE